MFHVFASVIQGYKICVHLVCYLMHFIFFGLFSYSYALSATVLTLWVAPPKISIGFNEAN